MVRKPWALWGITLGLSLVATYPPPPVEATTVAELDFLAIHKRAATLFHGKCLTRKEIFEKGPLPYTEYTFEVIETIKGSEQLRQGKVKKVTFRHVGTRTPYIRPDGLAVPPLRLGVPEYDPGDEVVLFLTKESRWRLCAPVGLVQGAFRVKREKGKAHVRNRLGNRRLFKGVLPTSFNGLRAGVVAALQSSGKSPTGESMELADFLELCRKAKSP